MFFIHRLPRIPPGTASIYLNRVYHRRQNASNKARFFSTSSTRDSTSSDGTFGVDKGYHDNTPTSSRPDAVVGNKAIPKLAVRWYYATDVPNSQPAAYNYVKEKEPTEFLPFTERDSNLLEKQFQTYVDGTGETLPGFEPHLVPVNEDRLFECDLQNFEMRPIYWDGAHYEIRRGIWFDPEKRPARQELADELERLYNEIKPFAVDVNQNADASTLIKHLESLDKVAVFSKDNTVYLVDDYGGIANLPIKYLALGKIPPLIPVVKFSRGYTKDEPKEKLNKDQRQEKTLKKPVFEHEIKDDYSNKVQQREIDHLVICVHGIGQILGTKYESLNFIHTINVLRQQMKSVFKENKTLQKIAYNESTPDDENCKVQVLPIVWRHKLEFGSTVKKTDNSDDKINLSDITLDGIRPLRNMLGDIVLDVLLYYEPQYIDQILEQVVTEVNDVYSKYVQKNPNFKGKVSLMGHSLGSAICLDILCNQPDVVPGDKDFDAKKHLKFPVENFFAVGSPIGVFGLLKSSKLEPRPRGDQVLQPNSKSPNVKNFYNVFHPCDPIAYRIEPLISKEFANYKPAAIPFTSKTIDTQIQNLTQMGDDLTNKVITNLNSALGSITPKFSKPKPDKEEHVSTVSQPGLNSMTEFNYSGRVDYALPAGIFEISILSAINSHVSYFEDPNVSGFMIKELLTNKRIVKDKKVLLMDEDEEYFTVDEEG